jgi:thymidylate kinase
MNNIIAFSGTHGTGKSSCAYSLASRMKRKGFSVVVCDELARECPLPINQAAGDLTQYWIIAAQMKREITLMDRYDFVISDRTVFDALAYGVSLNVVPPVWAEALKYYIYSTCRDIFLLDPEGFDYHISDGVRDMDIDFRMNVHHRLKALYDNNEVEYTLVSDPKHLQLLFESKI